jgi:hypothetical protein
VEHPGRLRTGVAGRHHQDPEVRQGLQRRSQVPGGVGRTDEEEQKGKQSQIAEDPALDQSTYSKNRYFPVIKIQ